MKRVMWRAVGSLLALGWAWAQMGLPRFPQGPGGGPRVPGASAQVYQNPALGMAFPIPPGFQLAQEVPFAGGLTVLLMHPMGAELYAISMDLGQPLDLQGFH